MIRRYPSVFLLIFIVAGVVLADLSRLPVWLFILAAFGCCVAGILWLGSQKYPRAVLSCALGLAYFAAFHFALRYYDSGPNHISRLVSHAGYYHIYASVTDWPDLKADRTEIKLEIDSLFDNSGRCVRRVLGAVLLRVADTTTVLQRGDRLEFAGRIYPVKSPGVTTDYDYRRHLNLKNVYGVIYLPTLLDVRIDQGNRYGIYKLVDRLRTAIRQSLYANLSAESAALAAGFLIGETRDIPPEIYRRFRDSGTLHLLAVSGSNVGLVVLFFIIIMRPFAFSPKRRALILLVVLVVFALLSYGEPSVLRASVMAGLIIIGGYLQRSYDLNNIIAAAAVIIILFDPAQLFDVGFQLSFVTAWALVFFVPRLAVRFKRFQVRWWYRWVVLPFIVSLAAQLGSSGLMAYYFHQLPLISPLANLLVVPLVSVAVIGIMAVLVAHLVLPFFGLLVGSWLNLLLRLVLELVNTFGSERIPNPDIPSFPGWVVLIFYGLLFGGIWALPRKKARRVVIITAIVAVNIGLVSVVLTMLFSRPTLRASFFNVPGGIAAVIRSPHSDRADLIITGLQSRNYPVGEKVLIAQVKKAGIKHLGVVFVLSADYHALAELVRTAEFFEADSICLSSDLEPSLRETVARIGTTDWNQRLRTFGGAVARVEQPGYYPSGTGLIFFTGRTAVVFSDMAGTNLYNLADQIDAENRVLVLGYNWRLTTEDLKSLNFERYPTIICSKLAQAVGEQPEPDGDDVFDVKPDRIYDLTETGMLNLELTAP